jgi:hypothetical protein
LFTKKILLPRKDHYNAYILGIGLGTFFGNCVFIFGGVLIASSISNNQNILNWVIGGIFALTAVIQVWKMIKKKNAVHQIEHPEVVTHGLEDKIIEITDQHEPKEKFK